MQKNKTMRIASVLLIAVLLTTSIISGTFAKYVAYDEIGDSARVAKFGVVVLGEGSLFDTTYYSVEEGNKPGNGAEDTNDTVLTVESSTSDKLVAPGTQNPDGGMTITVTGMPEVDVNVTVGVTVKNDVYLKAGTYPDVRTGDDDDTFTLANDYYPVVYTLTKNNSEILVTGTIEEVKAELESFAGRYDANTDLGNVIGELKLTWKWAFEGPQKIGEYNFTGVEVDQADTLLGDLIANQLGATENSEVATVAADNYNLDTGITITITVTQVD